MSVISKSTRWSLSYHKRRFWVYLTADSCHMFLPKSDKLPTNESWSNALYMHYGNWSHYQELEIYTVSSLHVFQYATSFHQIHNFGAKFFFLYLLTERNGPKDVKCLTVIKNIHFNETFYLYVHISILTLLSLIYNFKCFINF